MLLVSNKYDLVEGIENEGKTLEPYMTQDYLDDFAAQHNFIGAIRGSAKTGFNISIAFSQLVREIFKREVQGSVQNEKAKLPYNVKQSFRLNNNHNEEEEGEKKKKKGCC